MVNKKILIIGVTILICLFVGFLLLGQILTQFPSKKELKLSDFPEAFKDSTLIVVGDNASEIEMQATNEIAKYLKNKTGNKPLIKKYSEITEEDRRNYNLIVVGTPKTNSLLEEVYVVADAMRVTEEFPGEGRGVLEILRNPWDEEEKNLFLIEGADDITLRNSVCLLFLHRELNNVKIGPLMREFLENLKIRNMIDVPRFGPTLFSRVQPDKNMISKIKKFTEITNIEKAPDWYPINSPYWIINIESFCNFSRLLDYVNNEERIEKIDMWYLGNKKVSPELLKQIFYGSLNETVKVYIHFYHKPNETEISKLKALGVKINENSWIPHSFRPGGFYSAEIPVDAVFKVAKFNFVEMINPAEGPTFLTREKPLKLPEIQEVRE